MAVNLAALYGAWPLPAKNAPKSIYDIALIRAASRGILVPIWCPKQLIAEYADCAITHGEERAASHVRKLKRELAL